MMGASGSAALVFLREPLVMATVPAPRRRQPPAPPEPSLAEQRLCLRIPTSALTWTGFRDWATSPDFPDHVRAAFIGEEIYLDMSNEEVEAHVAVKTEVYAVLGPIVRAEGLGRFYSDGLLISNEPAQVSNNPDASFCSGESLRSGRVRLVPREGKPGRYREIEGTPDWVLEVLSDSSVQKDTERLRVAYHAAGIPEYWLIDARGEEIVFTILHWRKNGYAAAPVKDGWQRSKVFGREFHFVRRPDEFGLWEHTLEVRPG
jgi:Uma2 family endonuclease